MHITLRQLQVIQVAVRVEGVYVPYPRGEKALCATLQR